MFKSNLLIFLTLLLLGILVHYPSFNLSLYGDDWLTIYLFFVPQDDPTRFGPLPGVLSFLTPYGPSVLMIGNLYQLFGTHYPFYYLIALVLRTLAAGALYLACRQITQNKLVSFLTATLFLVGFTGLQTTDWVFYMNVYLAISLFLFGLFFKVKFFRNKEKKNLYLSLLFDLASIIAAPVRLYQVVFLSPLVDVIFLLLEKAQRKRFSLKPVVIKNIIFAAAVTLFWAIGVFGTPGRIYSPDWSVSDFLAIVTSQPVDALKFFFHWLGATLIPVNLIKDVESMQIIGMLFLFILLFYILGSLRMVYRKDRVSLLVGSLLFFISLLTIWWYAPLRLISSEDRYLLLPFALGCLLIGILTTSTAHFLRKGVILFLIFLIALHFTATRSMYHYWLSKGRDVTFARVVDEQITKDFPSPVVLPKIIFLDADDQAVLHSLQFGLVFKILVLSKTRDQLNFRSVYNEKTKLIEGVTDKISRGGNKEEVIGNVHAYSFRDNRLSDTTLSVREELSRQVSER